MYKVIIADDEHLVKLGLRTLLHDETTDFRVIGEAEDGAEALALIERLQPDLLLTDIRMPVMDGLELLREVHGRELRTETVLVSGYGEFAYAQEALRYGAADYLLKPIQADALLALLGRLREKWRAERGGDGADTAAGGSERGGRAGGRDAAEGDGETERGGDAVAGWAGPEAVVEVDDARLVRAVSPAASFLRAEAEAGHSGYKPLVAEALAYMESRFDDPQFSLSEVAGHLHISPAYFSFMFKKIEGVPFIQYLTRMRMERAKAMLQDGNNKIYVVGHAVGYPEYTHFTKAFKKYAGCSPTEYRQQLEEGG
ncbi:response regulator [Paenibacillus sp. HJGM_3]|uniref:response regulator transcription factor n=1 Tax=Paenibacillus sp. HJGM_3 TaxID=3379816 RepID=UPI00385DB026